MNSAFPNPIANACSRRRWLAGMGGGLGSLALAELLRAEGGNAGTALPHFAPKAKRVIYLFMSGGISQLESFDYKPVLNQRVGEEMPASVRGGKPLLGMSKNQAATLLVGSPFEFKQHGQSGAWMSDRFPHLAELADDLAFVKSLYSEAVNHDPALTFMQTGAPLPFRPTIGSWLSYGLGSENGNLPAFIVLVSNRPADQPLSSRLWDCGFLPTEHQGVQFRSGADAVLYLSNPKGVSAAAARRTIDGLNELHRLELAAFPAHCEVEAKIQQFEMASRMQMAVPEATDIKTEPRDVLEMYGPDVEKPGSFAANCLHACRLAERGVRMVQLFHPGWDHHGGLPDGFKEGAAEIDQPCAALIKDLKRRGLLKDTLVVFGTEFGRTCYSQGSIVKSSGSFGREHHRDCFTFWMAGGGVKPGVCYGETDEFGFNIARDPVHVNDLHATLLHLLGIDHERFTYRHQGRDFRLTDVAGKAVKELLA